MKKITLIIGFICVFALRLATTCNAQTSDTTNLPTIIQDTSLSQQMHVNVDCSYNEFIMQDSVCSITVIHDGGLTRWVKCTAWLYNKKGDKVNKLDIVYFLKDADYLAFWTYGLPYAYRYMCDKLNLTIQE